MVGVMKKSAAAGSASANLLYTWQFLSGRSRSARATCKWMNNMAGTYATCKNLAMAPNRIIQSMYPAPKNYLFYLTAMKKLFQYCVKYASWYLSHSKAFASVQACHISSFAKNRSVAYVDLY